MTRRCSALRVVVLALEVADVDLETGLLVVDKTMLELKSGERTVGPPKTAAGRRVVTVPPHLRDLAEHIGRFLPGVPDGLATGERGGPVRRLVFRKFWKQAAAAIGMPHLHFHDLRHAGATLAAAAGASTRELMLRLGHSSPSAALRYQHATSERDAVIAKALTDLAAAAQISGEAPSTAWRTCWRQRRWREKTRAVKPLKAARLWHDARSG